MRSLSQFGLVQRYPDEEATPQLFLFEAENSIPEKYDYVFPGVVVIVPEITQFYGYLSACVSEVFREKSALLRRAKQSYHHRHHATHNTPTRYVSDAAHTRHHATHHRHATSLPATHIITRRIHILLSPRSQQ
eukprot:786037-Pyramimonas_sp.AAC.1